MRGQTVRKSRKMTDPQVSQRRYDATPTAETGEILSLLLHGALGRRRQASCFHLATAESAGALTMACSPTHRPPLVPLRLLSDSP